MHNIVSAPTRLRNIFAPALLAAADRAVPVVTRGRYVAPGELDAERRRAFAYGLTTGRAEAAAS